MPRVAHIIGNGDFAPLYSKEKRKGMVLTCNLPPFEVPEAYATTIVDFKFMRAVDKGEISPPGEWICGVRPKAYCEKSPKFYMRVASRIKEFYTKKPKYAKNYTDFNCGHFAAYWALEKGKADVVHFYGFDSVFDFNLRSYSDLVLNSDRGNTNNNRLIDNWRPIWEGMFKQFPNTEFVWHHNHDNMKLKKEKNVRIELNK